MFTHKRFKINDRLNPKFLKLDLKQVDKLVVEYYKPFTAWMPSVKNTNGQIYHILLCMSDYLKELIIIQKEKQE